MLASSIPAKFPIPFGFAAGAGFIRPIPTASQIGINPGFASLTDGFPPLNFTPVGAGGVPPYGADFNGVLSQITLWEQWAQAGGPIVWDSAFSTAIGGYPNGAIIQSAVVQGNSWMSIADNNTTNPDIGGANWIVAPGTLGTGFISWTPFNVVPSGWIALQGGTLGSASSGANFANASAAPAYAMIWNGFSQAVCPVSGGRGATPAADFVANKTITVPNLSGTGIMGTSSSSGRLNGVPVVSGSITIPGSVVGENLHTIITTELAAHTHSNSLVDPGHFHSQSNSAIQSNVSGTANGAGLPIVGNVSPATITINVSGTGQSITNANQGSNAPHNTVELNMIGIFLLHL